MQELHALFYIATRQAQGGGGGGGGEGVGHDLLAESPIFYPYTLHGVFGKDISWSVVTSVH